MFRKLALVATLAAIAVPAFADTLQRERIAQGIRSGELTRPEARRLVRGEVRVHRHERIARSDGIVTRGERVRLNRHADRMSRRIYRQKHDLQ